MSAPAATNSKFLLRLFQTSGTFIRNLDLSGSSLRGCDEDDKEDLFARLVYLAEGGLHSVNLSGSDPSALCLNSHWSAHRSFFYCCRMFLRPHHFDQVVVGHVSVPYNSIPCVSSLGLCFFSFSTSRQIQPHDAQYISVPFSPSRPDHSLSPNLSQEAQHRRSPTTFQHTPPRPPPFSSPTRVTRRLLQHLAHGCVNQSPTAHH